MSAHGTTPATGPWWRSLRLDRRSRAMMARVLRLSWAERRSLSWGMVFLAIGSGATLAFPQLIGDMIEQALESGQASAIDRLALGMVGVFALMGVATGMRAYLFTVVGERVVTRLRQQVYRHVMGLDIAFFDGRRTGELLSRLASDTSVLQNTVSVNISMFLRNLVGAVGGITLLLWSSPSLAFLMLSVVPVVSIGAVAFGRVIRRISRDVQDALARAGEVAEETIGAIRTVRAFNHENFEGARYGQAVDHSFDLARQRASALAWFSSISTFAGYVALVVVLWYGGHLVARAEMGIGELTRFIVYTLMVAFSLAALAALYADFVRAVGAAERVFELLDEPPALVVGSGRKLDHVSGRVQLQAVEFSYPSRLDVEVLRGVDLELHPSQVTALVGASGGGKSTIAALLTRFYDPTGGQVLIDGVPLTELDPVWWRDQVAVVEQEPTLLSTTIAANIRYGDESATDEQLWAAAEEANAADFIRSFPQQMDTPVGERGIQLSGGQKQRVAIARAMLKSPRVLILDEATSALDAASEQLVQQALERLMRGRTTLVIAHRLSTVRDADQVAVIEAGRVVQRGCHDELVAADGPYRRLVERQLDTVRRPGA